MNTFIIYLALILVGLCFGSFAGASVWRLRARQLKDDKKNDEDYDKKEYAQLEKLITKDPLKDHSQCLHCSYVLRWYDLIPVVSWLSLGGKCRNCRKRIGTMEPLIELGVAAFFVLSFLLWPYHLGTGLEIARFIVWLAAGVGLAILFFYDLKWFLLPDKANFAVIGLGVLTSIIVVLQADDYVAAFFSIIGSAVILSGVYLLLYLVSKGRWIGFGDIKLGLGLALLLSDWRLGFIALFAANLIGCLVVIPAMARGKLKRDSHVPFGPLLIAGAIVAQFVGLYLADMYGYALL
jgi:leader peptidase (prepilin peptidase)/N-methyltransferase